MIAAPMHGKRSVFLFVLLAGILVGLGEHGGFAFADELEFTPSQRQDFSEEELRRQFPPKKVEPYPLEIESARTLPDENKIILPPLTAKERSGLDNRSGIIGLSRIVKAKIADRWKFVTQKRAYGTEINVWQMAAVSPGAKRVKAKLSAISLPKGAFIYTYGLNARQPYRIQSTYKDTTSSTFSVDGDTLIVEYHVPVEFPGPNDLEPCVIDSIGHFALEHDINDQSSILAKTDCPKSKYDCNNDICDYYSSFGQTSRPVAQLIIKKKVDGKNRYYGCTGTLIVNKTGDFTPFFLTAYHCLSDDTVKQAANQQDRLNALNNIANDIEFIWRYTSSCGASFSTGKAKYLIGKSADVAIFPNNTDYALLMLLGAVLPDENNEVLFAGTLRAEVLEDNADVITIHHPRDAPMDYKRISFGDNRFDLKFDNDKDGVVDETYPDYKNYYTVQWRSGVTEQGSSGSPLFVNYAGKELLTGHLHGGYSLCNFDICDGRTIGPDRPAYYGKFFYTYNDINKSLNPVTVGNLIVGGADDEYDKGAGNDDFDHARPFTPNTDLKYGPLVVKWADRDWYSVTLKSQQKLIVEADFTHAYGDIDVRMFGENGSLLINEDGSEAWGRSNDDNEKVEYTNYDTSCAEKTVNTEVFLYRGQRNEYSLGMTITGAPPTFAKNLDASDGDFNDHVLVSWAGCADSFDIYRSTSADGEKIFLASTADNFIEDFNAEPGVQYFYWINAINDYGESGYSVATAGYVNADCAESVSPEKSVHGPGSSDTGRIIVKAPAECQWTAISSVDWITITSGADGSGDGAVSYSVDVNLEGQARIGAISVSGQAFTLRQNGSQCE
ncbi:MAG: hypothetical protein ACNS63_05420 [Candidatus Nitrospinota bacterium M3_3B_026]